MLSFTSMDGKIDNAINRRGHGPFMFRLRGHNYHKIGTLLPQESKPPKLHNCIFDADNEVENRASAIRNISSFSLLIYSSSMSGSAGPSNERHPIETKIIGDVRDILDGCNKLVETFRMARDRYNEKTEQSIKIKLITKRAKDGHTYNLPTASKVVGLIVGDVDSCAEQRHIVIEMRKGGLQRINIFHPSHLPI
ncbi:hypothetical protein Tco_1112457 [Tanacetum coccineum]|uniref:Uncharacterized protein n=1 Tax=Tanacetum coccineum TaxID=301880 RepID=A0ABQ5IPP8_9ASTR